MSTPEFSTTSRLGRPEDLIPKEKNWPKRGKNKEKKKGLLQNAAFLSWVRLEKRGGRWNWEINRTKVQTMVDYIVIGSRQSLCSKEEQ